MLHKLWRKKIRSQEWETIESNMYNVSVWKYIYMHIKLYNYNFQKLHQDTMNSNEIKESHEIMMI